MEILYIYLIVVAVIFLIAEIIAHFKDNNAAMAFVIIVALLPVFIIVFTFEGLKSFTKLIRKKEKEEHVE